MIRRFLESSILFIELIRWFFIAALTGIIVGVAITYFLMALNWSVNNAGDIWWIVILMPAALYASGYLVKRYAPDAMGHGTEKVIEAIHRRSGRIPLRVVPVKALATIITIAFGGSAGKEGPAAQIGAGLASQFATVFHMTDADRKKIVVCGISAGFATVFGTPIAGALFGVEVLFVGAIVYDVLFPSFVAGIVSFQTARWLGLTYGHEFKAFVIETGLVPIVEVLLAGVFFGLLALLFIESMKYADKTVKRFILPMHKMALLGGGTLVLIAVLFGRSYMGMGLTQAYTVVRGGGVSFLAPFIKMITTSITLHFGGSGGTLGPVFFIGSTGGYLWATVFHLDTAVFAAIGMVAVLAGAANTPISASIMAVELFGSGIAPYAALACVVSFLMTGHRSVYPSQVLSFIKSPSFRIETGKELQDIRRSIRFRKEGKGLSSLLVRGSATAIRRIRSNSRSRSTLPVKIRRALKLSRGRNGLGKND